MKKPLLIIIAVISLIFAYGIFYYVDLEAQKSSGHQSCYYRFPRAQCAAMPLDNLPDPNVIQTDIRSVSTLSEQACRSRGYSWVPVPGACPGGSCDSVCDIPTKDGGKSCLSGADCEGKCVCGTNEKDADGFLIGECSRYLYAAEVSDCPCYIEQKARTRDEYVTSYCT